MSSEVEKVFRNISCDAIFASSSLLAERGKRTGVLLFGAGNTGRQIAARCEAGGVGGVLGFVDDVRGGKGETISNIPIFSRAEALAKFGPDILVVVCIYKVGCFFPKLEESLTASGFNLVRSLPDFARAHPGALMPFSFFSDVQILFDHRSEIVELYNALADEHSKIILSRWVNFRLSHQYHGMDRFDSHIYYPEFLTADLADPFLFVDCGAYDGDSIKGLLAWRSGRPARAIAFEPDPTNFLRMKEKVSPWVESGALTVDLHQAAVGARAGSMGFSETGDESAHIDASGARQVAVVTVDEVLQGGKQRASYIKYDIEGYEVDALIGSQLAIKSHAPMLAISLYHRPDDLWVLPRMIREWQPRYRLYLRQHAEEGIDTVLYAIDSSR